MRIVIKPLMQYELVTSHRMRLAFYPAFDDASSLTDHYYRLLWYLTPFKPEIDQIIIPHLLDHAEPGPPPAHLDSSLAGLANGLPVEFRKVEDDHGAEEALNEVDCVLLWASEVDGQSTITRAREGGRGVIRVDHHNEQFAGSFYLRFAEQFPDRQKASLKRGERRFRRVARRSKSELGYVFGTGPGLSTTGDHDFSDGITIACNSMVRNHALLERLQPNFLVVADPIFHAGCSSYAETFRRELIGAMERYDAELIVPLRDAHIYEHHMPSHVSERLIAVPMIAGETPNLALDEQLSVTTTGNVLTLFLLPLAATLFDTIRIAGCDGRPLTENSYFWSHDKSSQITEEMGRIQEAHPAFFAIDFDEYYETHCQTLATWLDHVEQKGKSVVNFTPSHIPALMERSYPRSAVEEMTPKVSIVMPAFNAALYIEEAVASVSGQSFEDWELLVVDDGSTDETAAMVHGWALEDRRISLIKNGGKGVSSARNLGLDRCGGEFVAFLDADDTLDPEAIKRRVEVLEQDESLLMTHAPARFVGQHGEDLGHRQALPREMSFKDMSGCPAHLNSVMLRRKIAERFRFEERLANGEDWLFLARIMRSGVKSRYVSDAGATYRVHPGSTVIKDKHAHEESVLEVVDWVYSPAEGPEIADEFRKPLQSASVELAYSQRRFHRVAWSLVSRDRGGLAEMLDTFPEGALEPDLPQAWFDNATALAGIRFFATSRDGLPGLDSAIREEIRAIMEEQRIGERLPKLAGAVGRAFSLDVAPTATEKPPSLATSHEPQRKEPLSRAALRRLEDRLDALEAAGAEAIRAESEDSGQKVIAQLKDRLDALEAAGAEAISGDQIESRIAAATGSAEELVDRLREEIRAELEGSGEKVIAQLKDRLDALEAAGAEAISGDQIESRIAAAIGSAEAIRAESEDSGQKVIAQLKDRLDALEAAGAEAISGDQIESRIAAATGSAEELVDRLREEIRAELEDSGEKVIAQLKDRLDALEAAGAEAISGDQIESRIAAATGSVRSLVSATRDEFKNELKLWDTRLASKLEESGASASEDGLGERVRALGDRLDAIQRNHEELATDGEDKSVWQARLDSESLRLRRHLSLRFARARASAAHFESVLLLVAPERSGSTWMLDLLRAHPGALLYPTSRLYGDLQVRGRRYPAHLSDNPSADLDIEVESGIGAALPSMHLFLPNDLAAEAARSTLAIEKIHPSAIRMDAGRFLESIKSFQDREGKRVEVCYLTRDPLESLRSFNAYRKRAPSWRRDTPETTELELYLRSFETMAELAANAQGPMVRYESLKADPISTLTEAYGAIWPAVSADANRTIAARAIALTNRERRREQQTGPFLADEVPDQAEADETPDTLKAVKRMRALRNRIHGAQSPDTKRDPAPSPRSDPPIKVL